MLEHINIRDNSRIISVRRNFSSLVEFLINPIKNSNLIPELNDLKFRANINEVDANSNTILHLLSGADLNLNIDPILSAEIIFELIIKFSANPRICHPEHGWTAAHFAAYHGKIEILTKLSEISIVLMESRDFANKRPIDLANEKKHRHCVNMLMNLKPPRPKLKATDFLYEIDRAAAMDILEATALNIRPELSNDGLFLIRRRSIVCNKTQNLMDSYVLTCVFNFKIYNYEISLVGINQGSALDRWYSICGGPKFESLDHLIEYYRNFSDGLPGKLTIACGRINRPIYAISLPDNQLDYDYTNFNRGMSLGHKSNIPKRKNIPENQIKIDKEVGSGEFGLVYSGSWTYDKSKRIIVKVALKCLFTAGGQNDNNRQAFLQEADIMLDLEHHCIVKLYGLVELDGTLMMVQEFVSYNGISSALDYIKINANDCHINDFIIWSSLICSGMKYLEERDYVHRDLALRNILIKNKSDVKISDFGLSRAVTQGSEAYNAKQGGKWPVRWYAPECINYGRFSSKSDVWSFGVTLWEMFSFGEQPYSGKGGKEVTEWISKGHRLNKPLDCPDKIYQKMRECWHADSEQRPSFLQLKEFFKKNPDYLEINLG